LVYFTMISCFAEKIVVGEIEKIYLEEIDHLFTARIDTGAVTSSIHADNITRFERDGERWVRFDIEIIEKPKKKKSKKKSKDKDSEVVNKPKKIITVERPIVRKVKIVQSNDDEAEKRIVVHFRYTIGTISQTAEFSLTDRKHLEFPVLVGRNILKDFMIVDVSKKNICPPDLKKSSNKKIKVPVVRPSDKQE